MAAKTRQQAHHELEQHQAEQLARIEREVLNTPPEQQPQATLPGDPRQLRGIPAIGVQGGLGGAIPGTRPDQR